MSLFRHQPQIAPSVMVLVLSIALPLAIVATLVALAPARMLQGGRAPNTYEASAAIAIEAATEQHDYNGVVFLGDSTGQCGLQSERFQDLTGLRAYGLGCPGALGIDGYALLLRLYLENHPRPRAVVLAVHPWALGADDAVAGPREVQERFFWYYGAPDFEFSNFPALIARTRSQLMDQFANLQGHPYTEFADEPMAGAMHWSFNELRNNIRSHRGYLVRPGELHAHDTRLGNFHDSFPITEKNRQSLRNLAAQAGRESLPLIIRLTPALVCQEAERFPQLLAFSQELEREFSNVTFSRPEVLEFPGDWFFDSLHLNPEGAERLTEIAADVVSGVLADGASRAPQRE